RHTRFSRDWSSDVCSSDLVAFLRTQIELIEHAFAQGEVDEIWITFPDPQIKYKRTKHRLTNQEFLDRYKKILKPAGLVHLKTDRSEEHTSELQSRENLVCR